MYPWRQQNKFELLKDGENYFPAILDAIHHAKQYVLIEMYLVASGAIATTFIDALILTASRGVQVYLLFDAHGSLMLSNADRYRLKQYANIHLCFYNPLRFSLRIHTWRNYLFRDHRKLIIIDAQAAFTGGTGLTDDFDIALRGGKHWRETVVKIHGQCIQDWRDAFVRQWLLASKSPCPLVSLDTAFESDYSQFGRVVTSPMRRRREVKRSLLNEIRHSTRCVYISSAYFVASRKIRRTLCRAARRNVDVRLLLPGPEIDHPSVRHMARRYYIGLLRHKIRIFEYQPRFLHSKVLMCDDWISIGSTNIDRWNLRWNFEANQEIRDERFASSVITMFEEDFSHSIEIRYDAWCQRTLYGRLLEWFWGKVDQVLANVHRHRQIEQGEEESEILVDRRSRNSAEHSSNKHTNSE